MPGLEGSTSSGSGTSTPRAQSAELFGRNLDAFWDAIECGGPGWPGEVRLRFTNSSALGGLMNSGGTRPFLDCLEIAEEATQIEVELA